MRTVRELPGSGIAIQEDLIDFRYRGAKYLLPDTPDIRRLISAIAHMSLEHRDLLKLVNEDDKPDFLDE